MNKTLRLYSPAEIFAAFLFWPAIVGTWYFTHNRNQHNGGSKVTLPLICGLAFDTFWITASYLILASGSTSDGILGRMMFVTLPRLFIGLMLMYSENEFQLQLKSSGISITRPDHLSGKAVLAIVGVSVLVIILFAYQYFR